MLGLPNSIVAILLALAPPAATSGRQGAAPDATPTLSPAAAAADRIARLEKMLERSPDNGGLMYELAISDVAAGRNADAIRWLEKAVSLGYDFDLSKEPAFAKLKKFEPYRELSHRLSLVPPVYRSSLAFRIAEPDLAPEGIAFDPVSRSFFIGSLARKKIVRVGPDGAAADFVPSGKDGIWTVLGLKVDAKRRLLWAASTADGREKEAEGSSALFAFDLSTGALRARHVLERRASSKHLLNDLAVSRDGSVFATDSEAGAVYRLAAGGEALEEWLPAGTFEYPNGIALDPEERRLYVADFTRGLSIVEIATKRVRPLPHPRDVTLHSIDGLSLFGSSLVAIQNGSGMERVARFGLDPTGERVTDVTVVESRNPDFDAPTTGALDGKNFYYLANTQLERLGDDGKWKPGPPPKDILVLKARLD